MRQATYIYIDLMKTEKAMPGFIRSAFASGALDDRQIAILGSGIGAVENG